jgi:hypothetical protein
MRRFYAAILIAWNVGTMSLLYAQSAAGISPQTVDAAASSGSQESEGSFPKRPNAYFLHRRPAHIYRLFTTQSTGRLDRIRSQGTPSLVLSVPRRVQIPVET